MYRPKVSILRAKWLKELKLKKEFKATTRFAKKKKQGNAIRQQPNNTL